MWIVTRGGSKCPQKGSEMDRVLCERPFKNEKEANRAGAYCNMKGITVPAATGILSGPEQRRRRPHMCHPEVRLRFACVISNSTPRPAPPVKTTHPPLCLLFGLAIRPGLLLLLPHRRKSVRPFGHTSLGQILQLATLDFLWWSTFRVQQGVHARQLPPRDGRDPGHAANNGTNKS